MKSQIKNIVGDQSGVPEENVRKIRDSKSRALVWMSTLSYSLISHFQLGQSGNLRGEIDA